MTRKFYISLVSCIGLAWLALGGNQAVASDLDLAETAGSVHLWHNNDGLPSDSVTAMVQTRDGFLWVGTTAGLAWFDGVRFTSLSLQASDAASPVYITALCEDSAGHLWIGTQQGGLFELTQGRLQHYVQKQGLLDDNVTSLAPDNHGQVWIGGKSGLCLWTGNSFRAFTKRDGLADEFVTGLNVARSGIVWITTRTGMCRFVDGHITPFVFQTDSQGRSPEYLGTYEDRRGNLWAFGDTYLINLAEGKRFNYFRSSESASVRIWSLCEGQDGRIWIGTSGRGLYCFEDNRFQPVIFGESRWPYDVRAIYEDRERNLWLGTSGGGLVQLRPQSVHVLPAGQGLPNRPPTALALDGSGRVYLGVPRGGLFVGESGRFDRVGGSDGLVVQDYITSVGVARNGGAVWVGTLGDGLYGLNAGREIHLTTAHGLADNNVLAVCLDSAGGVWASTAAGTVHHFDGQGTIRYGLIQGLPGSPVTAMIPSAAGGLWLGTQAGQILSESGGKIIGVSDSKSLGGFPVLALHEDGFGRLWIGTAGGGLACLVGETVTRWNAANGLPSDIVAGVVEDQLKNLWLATGAGIYWVNRGEIGRSLAHPEIPPACKLMAEAKTQPEPGMTSVGTRAVLAPDGELWFATADGVLNADNRQPEVGVSKIPLYLVSAAYNGQPAFSLLRGGLWSPPSPGSAPFTAPANLRSLEIHFVALDYAAPGELHFKHKLDGVDSDWVDDTGSRSARYNRIFYGHYRFRVAVRNANEVWQEAAEPFAFVVPTPFYLQTWAIGLFILAAVAVVVGIVRVVSHRRLRLALARLEQQQSLERERMRIARDMHDEMGSKLTKISFLSEHAQVDAQASGPLSEKIESIAQASRELLQTMDEIVWVVNPRNDTLENLVAYLSHYAMEYFSNTPVECDIRLPQEINRFPLSSEIRHHLFLTFEESLNNVLKHSGARRVKIGMALQGSEFEIRIADDGKGFELPVSPVNTASRGARGGNGLLNMRQRLLDIGGECLIDSRPGAGTTVTIRIHLNHKAVPKL